MATLSRRIARLESELGVLLFERGRAGAKPIIAGSSTLGLARKAIANMDAIRRNAIANGRADRGRLRLGIHLSTMGPTCALLKSWRDRHPEVAIGLTEIDDRALLMVLREHELSAAICFCELLPVSWSRRLTDRAGRSGRAWRTVAHPAGRQG